MTFNHWTTPLFCLFAACAVSACGEDTDPAASSSANAPTKSSCGVNACSVNEEMDDTYNPDKLPNEYINGKADAVDRVKRTLSEVTQDGTLDVLDVQEVFDAMGGKISVNEIRTMGELLEEPPQNLEITPEALVFAKRLAITANIDNNVEREVLLKGITFAGSTLPDEVKELVAQARLQGAVAYDVNEKDEDGDSIWSPYPATTEATENMAFDYTQITPQVLEDDINDVDVEYNRIVGSESATTTWGQEYKRARYELGQGGTGNITSHYDEVWHDDIWARGRSGQKWANNFAILSDGSIHCLPASRRSEAQDLILTNPHLSRGARMMFNGHLDVRKGVVVGVEMSGRLSKLAAKGKATFIDPIALLKAWGFEISPRVSLRYGNTRSGIPERVESLGVIRQAKP